MAFWQGHREEEPSREDLEELEESGYQVCVMCDIVTAEEKCPSCGGTYLRPALGLDLVEEEVEYA